MNSNVIPVFALTVAAGIFFFYVSPTWSGSIATMKASVVSDNKALSAAVTYAAQQNELADARNKIDPADLARLATFLPSSVDNVGLILDLNALTARSGLTLSSIDVAPSVAGSVESTDPVGSVDLALSTVGTYTALKAFLHSVEMSERLLDIRELSVKGSDTGVYSYSMKISLYWLR